MLLLRSLAENLENWWFNLKRNFAVSQFFNVTSFFTHYWLRLFCTGKLWQHGILIAISLIIVRLLCPVMVLFCVIREILVALHHQQIILQFWTDFFMFLLRSSDDFEEYWNILKRILWWYSSKQFFKLLDTNFLLVLVKFFFCRGKPY